jgi:hypothetical protein
VVGARREVARLSLTAGSEADVSRGRILVEDALRVASFPTTPDRRLLVIRRLDLGVVNPDRSSAAVASVIEEALRVAAAGAIRLGDPEAARADAVYAPDRVEATTAFFAALAESGRSPVEWFWPSVIPRLSACASAAEALRAAFAVLLAEPGGVVQAAAVMDALRRRHALPGVLALLGELDGASLLAAFGLPPVGDPAWIAPFGNGGARPPVADEWRDIVAAWAARWGTADPRSKWLAAMAVLSRSPAAAFDALLPTRATRLLMQGEAQASRPVPPTERPSGRDGGGPPRSAPLRERGPDPRSQVEGDGQGKDETPGPLPRGIVARRSPAPVRAPASGEGGAMVTPRRVARSIASSGLRPSHAGAAADSALTGEGPPRAWTDGLESSRGAGLLFAVPLLERLGIAPALAAQPWLLSSNAGFHLLERLADRVALSRDDVIRRALRTGRDGGEIDAAAAAAWIRRWRTRVARSCRRRAGLGLGALIRRDGRVTTTRTHIDVVFRLADSDLRIRRAGLDVDPGWVPWLGRVVRFHYQDER